ncbi:unnamed protein product [Prorocentrum cordatum]|uniref:Secreted protein n=1 Tax=Prorocentrum cordatum TaxID=2364126 RepID=A0ABN9PRN6_9DINO|nr:unnamed protein product [Polarella glacialis]
MPGALPRLLAGPLAARGAAILARRRVATLAAETRGLVVEDEDPGLVVVPLTGASTSLPDLRGGRANAFSLRGRHHGRQPAPELRGPRRHGLQPPLGAFLGLRRGALHGAQRILRERLRHRHGAGRLLGRGELRVGQAGGQARRGPSQDTVCLGHLCIRAELLSAQESAFPFLDLPFDGILGLGPPPAEVAVSGSVPSRELQRQAGLGAFAVRLGAAPEAGDGGHSGGELVLARDASLLERRSAAAGPLRWAPALEAPPRGARAAGGSCPWSP